jgi:hypothetical protein
MAAMPVRRPLTTAAARVAVAALVVLLATQAVTVARPHAASAEEAPGTSVTDPDDQVDEPVEGDDIIPLPNSGREPTEAGDRGGALQVLVFVLIVGGVGSIVGLAVRDARRSRAR